jgi:chloramphenicol-sensitive protein RarD
VPLRPVPTSAASGDAVTDAPNRRIGTLAGIAAYGMWGLFPLVFHQLRSVSAFEVLFHRVLWSFVVVVALLVAQGDRHWFARVRSSPGALARSSGAGLLIATNWLVYIWAVNHDHVVEAALGYDVNPLITVALGIVVFHERLRRLQVIAFVFGVVAVVVLTIAYERVPWIALVLALTFAGYGFLKKGVAIGAAASLAIETAVLLPVAVVGLGVMEIRGDAAFGHGSGGRDLLLVALGVITAGPLLLFGVAARRIPLSLLGLLQYLTPSLQLVCGVAVLGESLSPGRLAGFILVWIALALLAADALGIVRRPADSPRDISADKQYRCS